MAVSSLQRVQVASAALLEVLLLLSLVVSGSAGSADPIGMPGAVYSAGVVPVGERVRASPGSPSLRHSKSLLQNYLGGAERSLGAGGGADSAGLKGMQEETNRMGDGDCGKDDIVVSQSPSSPLPSGIPTYTVQVINTCLGTGCGDGISHVHLSCGWFSTARLINPKIFRRLRYDDCLVNDGRAIPAGSAVSFQYANTYPYKLSVSSVSCLPGGSR